MSRIAAVVLAAGTASRMGQQKLLLPLAGQPLLSHVLNTVCSLPWADCIVIIGEPEAELADLCYAKSIRYIYNAKRQRGQATSITLALQRLSPDIDGIMFLMGDQPLVSQQLLEALITQFAQTNSDKAIIVPCCQGERFSPVIFGQYWGLTLAALTGDTGGRQIIRANPERVVEVQWLERSSFFDADTWKDYQKIIVAKEGNYNIT